MKYKQVTHNSSSNTLTYFSPKNSRANQTLPNWKYVYARILWAAENFQISETFLLHTRNISAEAMLNCQKDENVFPSSKWSQNLLTEIFPSQFQQYLKVQFYGEQ